jgi:hypothetical protein
MTPKELLKATMQAANEVRLPGWHEALVQTDGKLSVLTTVSLVISGYSSTLIYQSTRGGR